MKEAISRIESYCGDIDCQRGMRNILQECKMLREHYSSEAVLAEVRAMRKDMTGVYRDDRILWDSGYNEAIDAVIVKLSEHFR